MPPCRFERKEGRVFGFEEERVGEKKREREREREREKDHEIMREEREELNIKKTIFFIPLCYSAVLPLGRYCSTMAKFFAFLHVSMFGC